MKYMNEFSIQRMVLLARKDFVESLKAILISTAAVMGVYLFATIIGMVPGDMDTRFHEGNYIFILMVGGLITTSLSFSDIHTKGKNIAWFMTPASQVEKYLVRLLETTVGMIVYTVVAYFLFSVFAHGVTMLLFHKGMGLFNPFQKQIGSWILRYIIIQSVFLFGAVYFKKTHFVKTILWIVIVGIFLSILTVLIFRIVFADYFDGMSFSIRAEINLNLNQLDTSWQLPLQIAGKIVLTIIAPFFWITGYFRLTETEVRNGV